MTGDRLREAAGACRCDVCGMLRDAADELDRLRLEVAELAARVVRLEGMA